MALWVLRWRRAAPACWPTISRGASRRLGSTVSPCSTALAGWRASPAMARIATTTEPRGKHDENHNESATTPAHAVRRHRSEEHTSELQSLMRLTYAVFCLKNKTNTPTI